MKEETKHVFAIPWKINYQVHACWEVDFEIGDANGYRVAVTPTEQDANRIKHIPDLWDALLEATERACWKCSCANKEYFLEHGCPRKNEECFVNGWVELLRNVKEGK